MKNRNARFLAAAACVILDSRAASAEIRLPALVSDGMVVEQKTPLRIWGYGSDGERVTVTFRGQTAKTAARDGQWSVMLKPSDAGGPFNMTIAGSNVIELKNVAVGEVWICGGQSNMEFGLADALGSKKEIEGANDPLLRMFTVGRKVADVPQADVAGGRWEAASPDTVGRFSVVAYFFGRALRRARKVPVGLIHSSWGGTPAEAWTNRSALEAWGLPSSAFKAIVHGQPNEDYERRVATWKAAGSPQGRYDDPGVAPLAKAWALAETDTGDWRPMLLPQRWENSGPDMEIDGGVWFRREIEIPAAWAGRELDLRLGAIDDFDTTYFNGVNVGATGAETPNFWEAPRRYQVPKEIVKAGRAVVAVRVWDHGGAGGLMGPADAMWIAPKTTAPDGPRTTLTGDWRFKIEASRPSHPGTPPGSDPNAPAVLYNGMIAPLLSYVIKGAIWYQGESNAGRAYQYRSLLSTMIRNWREAWGVGPFPFLIVELAPFMAIRSEPEESAWAELREAQHAVTKVLPNVGVAVITDAGDERDIHPKNKEPAGERLALAARRLAYGENVAASGPTYRAMRVALGKAIVSFEHVGKGLEVRGPRLTGFAIAGADKKFVWADAVVEGDVVVVSSPNVPAPAHVRFGWANYPVVNLWNKDGLPAAPFRTDAP